MLLIKKQATTNVVHIFSWHIHKSWDDPFTIDIKTFYKAILNVSVENIQSLMGVF